MQALILGCGFTGSRVARRLLSKGVSVLATARTPERLAGLDVEIVGLAALPARLRPGALVLHSIPPEGGPNEPHRGDAGPESVSSAGPASELAVLRDSKSDLQKLLGDKPSRLVYLSSTAVYGSAEIVNETTPPDPGTERARARLEVERAVAEGPWSSLILRPAAIYGRGRGVYERVKRGEREFSGWIVSRIHVEDLAAHCEAALLSAVGGAYPVADEEPASSREVAAYYAGLLGLPVPDRAAAPGLSRFTGNRRVDGSAIRRELGIELAYPSYRTAGSAG